jgi:hypothetical protein
LLGPAFTAFFFSSFFFGDAWRGDIPSNQLPGYKTSGCPGIDNLEKTGYGQRLVFDGEKTTGKRWQTREKICIAMDNLDITNVEE